MNLYFSTCTDVWRPGGFLFPEVPNSWRCTTAEVSYTSSDNKYTVFNYITNKEYSYEEYKELLSEMRRITRNLRNRRLFH